LDEGGKRWGPVEMIEVRGMGKNGKGLVEKPEGGTQRKAGTGEAKLQGRGPKEYTYIKRESRGRV